MQFSDRDKRPEKEEGEIRLLKNPLPAPPRRSHMRMEFDLTGEVRDDFDLEISEDDDFDI